MPDLTRFDRRNTDKTFLELDSRFKEYLRRPTLRDPNSARKALIRVFRELPNVELDELEYVHFTHVIQRLRAQGYNPSYIQRLMRSTKAFLNWCREMDYIKKPLGSQIEIPGAEAKFIPSVVDSDYIKSITGWVIANGTHDDIVLWAALQSGARLSEPLAAEVEDIVLDLDTRTPFLWLGTKTGAEANRKHQLPSYAFDSCVAIAQASLGDAKALILGYGGVTAKPGAESPAEFSKWLSARTFHARERLYEIELASLGEKKFTPKEMRSTFITNNVREHPERVFDVAMQCGNSVETIRKHYYATQVQDFVYE